MRKWTELSQLLVQPRVLDSCPFWLIKTLWEALHVWNWAIVNNSLKEGVIPPPLKEITGPLLDPGQFSTSVQPPLFGEGGRETDRIAALENSG